MGINLPSAPTAPDLNSPDSYNADVLAGFNYTFSTLPAFLSGLSASDWFDVQQGAGDTTSGRVVTTDSAVLGGVASDNEAPSNDLNNHTAYGLCNLNSTTLNGPGYSSGICLAMPRSSGRTVQIAYEIRGQSEPASAMRISYGSVVWGEWRPITPEYGSNASGEFVKFADGTAICTRTIAAADRTTSSSSGGLNRAPAEAYNFPIALSSVEFVASSMPAGNGWFSACANTSTQWSLLLLRVEAASSLATNDTKLFAKGRWF